MELSRKVETKLRELCKSTKLISVIEIIYLYIISHGKMSLDWIYKQQPSGSVEVRNVGNYYGSALNINGHLISKTDEGYLVNIENVDWDGFIKIDFGDDVTYCLYSRLYNIDATFPIKCAFENPKNEYYILLIFYDDNHPDWKIMLRDRVWNEESDEYQTVTKGFVTKDERGIVVPELEGCGNKTKSVR